MKPNDSIRVLHLVTSSVSTALMRGQLRFLAERNFDVIFASSPGEELADFSKTEQVQSFTVPMVREISLFKDFCSFFRLCAFLRRVRPTITNVSTPKAGLLGGLAAFVSRVPCRVYTLRGLRWETTRGLKRLVLLIAEWVACHCAHRVICVSQSVRNRVEAAGLVDRDRVIVLEAGSSNGVDSQRFEPTPEKQARAAELRRHFAIAPNALVVGYVGRLTLDKGIAELYAAHAMLRAEIPFLRLLLVGDFESEDPLPSGVRQSIESDPTVVRTGFAADAADLYQVFDVFALPSYREGLPNVLLEAQAAGKPVVSTHATGIVDAVVDGVTAILVPVGDAKALAGALRRLLGDPALCAQMGAEGRARVRKYFAPQAIWEALTHEYFRLLQDKGLPIPSPKMLSLGPPEESVVHFR